MNTFLLAIGFVLLIEGFGPFVIPNAWRRMLLEVSQQNENQLRRIGGCLVVTGLVIIFMLTQ